MDDGTAGRNEGDEARGLAAPAALERENIARPRGQTGPDLSGSRILIVDDEPLNVSLLERMLGRSGFGSLRGTTRSSEAAGLFDEMKPDLVLLDLNMPEPDGFDVLRLLRERMPPGEYVPILILTGDDSPAVRRRALAAGARDFVAKPFQADEVLLRIRNLLETRWLHERMREHAQELEEKVAARTEELRRAQEEALELLALASEYRDDDTGQHTRRVGVVAGLLARELGLEDEVVDLVSRAGPLHDVGKIGVPDGILLKSGPIDAREREVMRRHTTIGSRILSRSSFPLLALAAEIAACHHEWWDGTGYPAGLRGEEIPLTSRIVALADVFDSLTHARPYKDAWPLEDAVAEITAYRGLQFDPAVVDAFLRLHAEGHLEPTALNEAALAAVHTGEAADAAGESGGRGRTTGDGGDA